MKDEITLLCAWLCRY